MNSDLLKPPADPPPADTLAAFDDALASGSPPAPNLPLPAADDEILLRLLDQLRPRTSGPAPADGATSREPERRYVLKGLHAAGGIGQVWLADDADLGREVALKVLRPERALDPVQEARFLHEARVTGRLQHPGIVPVYELVAGAEQDQPPFYTMRLVPGRTLTEAARSYHERRAGGIAGRIECVRLLHAFVSVCQTVAYAHSKGVIHRDLKPQNVALGDFGEVIVLDWGFAKALGAPDFKPASTTETVCSAPAGYTPGGGVVGTPSYMAPEQAAGRPEADGTGVDVYGLGAILYEILTGAPPYRGDDSVEVLREVRSGPPPRPSAITRVPPGLEAICLRAMARDPAQRYPNATVLARDVQHWLADEPVDAYRESRAARARRWLRRHPALGAGCCVLLVTTLVGIGVARDLMSREEARFAEDQARMAWEQAETKARSAAELRQQLYYHRIALAERALAALNLSGATQLLADCPPSLRGWEWHCLDRLCRADAQLLRGHANTVVALAFSPDGQSLASCGFDGSTRVWDLATGRVRLTYTGHEGMVYHLTFSPDGRRIASAGWDGTVRIWQADTGQTIQVLRGLGEHVNRVAYTPDGRRLLTLDQDKTLRLWELADGHVLWVLDGGDDSTWHLMTLAMRPNARLAAVSGAFPPIRLVDLETGQVVGRLEGRQKLVRALAFSHDGKHLASGDGDVGRSEPGEVRIWDVDRRETVQIFRGHTESIFALDFRKDGDRLVSASQDQTVRVWDLNTGQEALTLHGHTGAVRCAAFSPDGLRLATAGADQVIRVWDATPDAAAPPPRLLHSLTDPDGVVFAVAFDPTGRLASLGDGRAVRFYADSKPDGVSPPLMQQADFFALAYSPDGRHIASAGSRGNVVVLDGRTGRMERELTGHAGGPIKGVAYSADGTMLATASWDRTVRIWDPATGEQLRILGGHREPVSGVAFSPDGRWLASAGNDRMVRIWNPHTGKELRALPHAGAVLAVAVSPTGPVLASAGDDGIVRLWDTRTWRLRRELPGHAGAVRALAFSPDGTLLASGGQDWTVKVWRPLRGEAAFTLRGHTERVHGLAFHPDGRRLATAGYDGTVKVWDVSVPSE
jgi:eukaryotic-like serine/threonine-protein kinase